VKGSYDVGFLAASQDRPISTLKEASRLLKLDYGIEHVYLSATPDGGVPRKSDATPEGIVLKAEEPPASP